MTGEAVDLVMHWHPGRLSRVGDAFREELPRTADAYRTEGRASQPRTSRPGP